jgi:hypothetical protein
MKQALLAAFTLILAVTFARAQTSQSKGATPPNIVFILMDNLGYGELGVYGGGITRGAPTPRIDQLAAEGTRLTNFNVASARVYPENGGGRDMKSGPI